MKMNILSKRLMVLFLALTIFWMSCVKNSTTSPPVQNISVWQRIKSATNLTILSAALVRAGLDTVLNNPDSPVTVFAATDQIMGTNGLTAAVIDTMNLPALKTLLEYCIINGSIHFSSYAGNPLTNLSTIVSSGDSVFITDTLGEVYVNGISVPTTDVSAGSAGFLDVLTRPLFPPAGLILQMTRSDTALSYFDSAVALTAGSATDIQALLSSGIYTVFVPNNTAFRNAGYANVDTFSKIAVNTLSNFLSYHIVAGRYFTSDMSIALASPLVNNDTTSKVTISSMGDSAIRVTLGISYQVEGAADSVAANLYAPNIMARNGVVHKIDRILFQ